MLVTLAGILMAVSAVELANALFPILVTLAGILMAVSAVVEANAKFLMLVTVVGILIEVNDEKKNASSSIIVTPAGISTAALQLPPADTTPLVIVY